MAVSMGLVNSDDIFLTEWQGSILGPSGVSNLIEAHILLSLMCTQCIFFCFRPFLTADYMN